MHVSTYILLDWTIIELCRSQSHPDVKGGMQTNGIPSLWVRINRGEWAMAPEMSTLKLNRLIEQCDTREEFEVLVMGRKTL